MQSAVPSNSPDTSTHPVASDDAFLLELIVREAEVFGPGGEDLSSVLARLEGATPGWWSLAELEGIDVESLSTPDALAYLRVVVAHQGWLESLATRAVATAAGAAERTERIAAAADRPVIEITDAVREEVAAALRLAPVTAHGRIQAARTMVAHLPGTITALSQGQITGMHARVVADALAQVNPSVTTEVAGKLEARILPRAGQATVGELRSSVRRAMRRLDPEGVTDRASAARRELDVHVWHDPAGVSTLSARLLTEQAIAVAAAINRAALRDLRSTDRDPRTAGQRRSEALVALVLRPTESAVSVSVGGTGSACDGDQTPTSDGATSGHSGPSARAALTADVVLVMDLPTWLGLRDDPVAVLGGGELPADVARDLAADGAFRRAITDPITGHLLDYGRRTYAVPDALRRYLLMRDQSCRFPGCGRGAERCQADHAIAWDDGGPTSADNLGMLCQRHHQLKTHGGWSLDEHREGGRTVWRSPSGRAYEVDPPVLIEPESPDFRGPDPPE